MMEDKIAILALTVHVGLVKAMKKLVDYLYEQTSKSLETIKQGN